MTSAAIRIVTIKPKGYLHSETFAELAQTFRDAFQELGAPAQLTENRFDPAAVNLILGWHLLDAAQEAALPPQCILYNLEQMDERNRHLRDRLVRLSGRCEVWDYSRRNIEILHRAGIAKGIQLVPIGTVPGLSRIPVAADQDIDVLFYGSINERRKHILEALQATGLRVHAVFGVYGRKRDALIARAKVVLNLHYYESSILEMVRLSYLWANRKAVVAECRPETDLEEGLEGAARFVPYDQLVAACQGLVADAAARKALEARAYEVMAARSETEILRRVLAGEAEVLPSAEPAPAADAPLCSLVIPVFNKVEYTRQCVEQLRESTPDDLYELIFIDNASSDDTPAYLAGLTGRVRVITNPDNRGFVDACNQGAAVARGRYLVFLNNDTAPLPGWLEALVAMAEGDPAVGAAGAQLVYPDGRLQEAGGLIFSDGSGWNFGRFADPLDPAYLVPAEVDYCSGAALLVRRELFERLGGFDRRYAPAYYEDTDLCFGLRSLGYKVMYCPTSTVLHFEGITAGTDLARGFKRYQAINREKFVQKWAAALAEQDPPPTVTGRPPTTADRRRLAAPAPGAAPAPHILIVDPFLPLHDRASGSLRLFRILLILRALKYDITYIARNGLGQESYQRQLEAIGVKVYATDPEKMAQLGHSCQAPAINLARILGERPCQLAWLSFYDIAEQYLPDIRKHSPGTAVVVDTVDVHFLRETRQAELAGDAAALAKAATTRERELRIYAQADCVVTVTDADAAVLREAGLQVPTATIPNIHPHVGTTPGWEDRQGLVFVGNFNHTPNIDAALWLIREILPKAQALVPRLHLTIVGPNPPAEVQALASPAISVLGWVPDTAPHLDAARVSVAPLRVGAGMKGKVGEALSRGLPVVTTSIGAEGMGLEDGRHVLVADDAEAFAEAIARLHEDRAAWESLAQAGRAFVDARYSVEAVGRRLQELFRGLGKTPARPAPAPGLPEGPLRARLIAFHLPQFHPIPENDAWWGGGFTEWTNVVRARPLFPGHHQPHLPQELGFYDLRLPEARQAQAELARKHGIEGFCFWHYWFDGKLLLERPLLDTLRSGTPDFPFCLAWANENWTRRWDGQDTEILQAQTYGGEADDTAHFNWMLPFLRDSRAITIEGRPVILIYRPGDLPQPRRTLDLWRRLAREAGLPGLYLVAIITSFRNQAQVWSEAGFDGELLFQPNFDEFARQAQVDMANGTVPQPRDQAVVANYRHLWPRWAKLSERTAQSTDLYASVVPGWDNTARRPRGAFILTDSHPEDYSAWLRLEIDRVQHRDPDRRIVFLNAWNEWAEGNHLEPDARSGRAFLEGTLAAVRPDPAGESAGPSTPSIPGTQPPRGTYRSIQALEDEVEAALARGDLDHALSSLVSFVRRVLASQGGDRLGEVDIALGHPTLDRCCASIGQRVLRTLPPGPQSAWQPASVYIASGLYKIGGHTRLLQDYICADKSRDHVILMTAFYPDIDRAAVERAFPSTRFEWAPDTTYAGKLHWLISRLRVLAPERLFLFNHHEDAVAVSAALPDLAREVYFVHHADHALSLGPYLPGVGHIDLTNTCHHVCSTELGIPSVFVPISAMDFGRNRTPLRRPDGDLTTCCSASSIAKLHRPGYRFRYVDLFPWLFHQGVARHIHIGPLANATLTQIAIRMDQEGMDRGRFIHRPFEPVYWQALDQLGVDVALGSFPTGGGRTCVEAMGSGTPYIAHQNYLQRNLGGQDTLYPHGWVWQDFEELGRALADLNGPGLALHAEEARAHFEAFHHHQRLEEALADHGGRLAGLVPPPVRTFRRDALQATLDILLRESDR